jgi:hypothetical protein
LKARSEGEVETGTSFMGAARHHILEEPAKGVALAYLWLTALGYTRTFGDGIAFGVNAIDLASPSDFLLAGLRDPIVVLVAAVSGIGLYWIWGKSVASRLWRLTLALTVLAFLVLGIVASGAYRHAVVAGKFKDCSFAPRLMTVTLDESQDGHPVALAGLRIVLTTTDFVFFYREPNETLIVKKSTIRRMELSSASMVGPSTKP